MNTPIHFTTILTGFILLGALHSCAADTAKPTVKTELTAAKSHATEKEPTAPAMSKQFFGCKAHR